MKKDLRRVLPVQQFCDGDAEVRLARERRDRDVQLLLPERAAREVRERRAQLKGLCLRLVRDDVEFDTIVLDVRADESVAVEASRVEVERLPAAEVVYAGPRGDGPAV